VTVSADGVGSPTIDVAQNTFTKTDSDPFGFISMYVEPKDDVTTFFNPTNWSGGGAAGTVHTTTSGWGVNDASGNGNLSGDEALILTFNFSGIAPGNVLKLASLNLGQDSAQLWKKELETNGVLIVEGALTVPALEVSDGDVFALVNSASTAMRLKEMKLDIVEIATGAATPTGLSALAGDSVAVLGWDDDTTGLLDFYTLFRGTTSGTNNYDFSTNVTDSAFLDSGLSGGTTYYYAVTATDTNGTETAYSDEVSATPFAASTNVVLIQHLDATSSASVTLTNGNEVIGWADQSGSGNDAVDGDGDPVLWPSASKSASSLSGMDVRTNQATLNLFSAADTEAFLNFPGAAVSNSGFCVMVAFKADNVQASQSHQIVFGNSSNFDDLTIRLESNGDLEGLLDGVPVNNAADVQDGDTVIMALNYKANTGLMEFWDSKTDTVSTDTAAIYGNFSSEGGTPLSVGGSSSSTRMLDGMIGDVKIFSSYLGAADFETEREALVAKWGSATGDRFIPWIASYGLSGAEAAPDYDAEPDGMDNLLEYALGGNPTNDDAAVILPGFSVAADGGSNWFYYVHNERTDDDTLTYTVEVKSNLVLDPSWETNGVEPVGESGAVGSFKSVTNRTDIGSAEFIRLNVEK